MYYAAGIAYLPLCLYHYRTNPDSICNSQVQTKKTIDEYNNFLVIYNFLNDKHLISDLENELYFRINTIKISFLKDKYLRKDINCILYDFHPESTNNLLKRKIGMGYLNKIILLLAIKNKHFAFFIIDISMFFEQLLKSVYRFFLPKNIRSILGKKRIEKQQNKQINNNIKLNYSE
jgi:hypothetical protein